MSKSPDKPVRSRKGTRWRWLLLVLALIFVPTLTWIGWTERNPDQERELRLLVQERLHEWFPEEMQLPDDQVGLIPRSACFAEDQPPDVVLVHGLDEPGGIWDELVEALDEVGINAWEFRYPNDQAIDHSADLLAETWPKLPDDRPLILIGHSMGGLVIRDFVSRWRHPVDDDSPGSGPPVRGTVLVATPNQGSEWARLRVWLELREMVADIPEGRFSLFAGLRDGTGAAKIDLRPDSTFLNELNDRPWPESVPVRIIGGAITEPDERMVENIEAVAGDLGSEDLARQLELWWAEAGAQLGDGAVPVESLELEHAPAPLVLDASHRGLLVSLPFSEGDPPAIEALIGIIKDWQ